MHRTDRQQLSNECSVMFIDLCVREGSDASKATGGGDRRCERLLRVLESHARLGYDAVAVEVAEIDCDAPNAAKALQPRGSSFQRAA